MVGFDGDWVEKDQVKWIATKLELQQRLHGNHHFEEAERKARHLRLLGMLWLLDWPQKQKIPNKGGSDKENWKQTNNKYFQNAPSSRRW
jgi:hypothetical protein